MKGLLQFTKITLLIVFLLNNSDLFAQSNITGTILEEDTGQPLPGASVVIKGTTIGTVTDVDGKYSIEVSENDVLAFSFIGYQPIEILVGTQQVINVSLEIGSSLLDDVIVMGYSLKSQKEISAATVSISSEDLQNVTSANIETMLQGQAAGVTVSSPSGAPGAGAEIRIRGITSINNDVPPLIVVDGIMGGNYVPGDVESITILKDAAAIGLYGAAGAAGVIVVTTKTGTGTPSISYSSSIGMKEAAMGNFQMMNGAELYEAQKQMWGTDQISFLSNRPGYLEDRNFDWMDAGFRKAKIANHFISMSGKSNDVSYGFNVDYFNEEGTFINTDYERVNLRANLKFKPTEKFQVQTDVNVQMSNSNFEHYSWFEDTYWNMPWDNPYADDGTLLGPDYVTNNTNEWYGQFRRSFLYSAEYDELGYKGNDITWSLNLNYNLTDWLSLETRTRLSNFSGRTNVYHAPNTDFGLPFNGTIGASQQSGNGLLSTHFLRFNKTINSHEIGGFIAQEGGYYKSESLNFAGQNLSSQTIKVPAGASVLSIPGGGSGTTFKSTGISYISELTYGYSSKYFLTAYFRRDGSSIFAENKQYGNFYGGSIGWLISEENFISNSGNIELLKLRLSTGLTGNSSIPAFLSLPTYNITRQYNGQPGGEPNNPANPDLGWESTNMMNLGIDISLAGGLSANIDVYQKSVEGMLLDNPLPFSSGYESRTENIGDMRNRGIEFNLSFDKDFGDFSYSGNFNIAYNSNYITKITDVLDEQTVQSSGVQQINRVGDPAFQWYMPKWLGVDPATGMPTWETVDVDANGNETRGVTSNYSEAAFQAVGSSLPVYSGGFQNSISYKDFSLTFLLTYQGGNNIYHQTRFNVDSDGANTGINLMKPMDDWVRWEKPGDIATHPEFKRGGNNSAHQHSSRYIEDGNYFRVRNITLSYSIPKSILDKVKIKGATISLKADNIFTSSKFSGMDPDISFSKGAYSLPGLSTLKYPISKQYLLGLNINL